MAVLTSIFTIFLMSANFSLGTLVGISHSMYCKIHLSQYRPIHGRGIFPLVLILLSPVLGSLLMIKSYSRPIPKYSNYYFYTGMFICGFSQYFLGAKIANYAGFNLWKFGSILFK